MATKRKRSSHYEVIALKRGQQSETIYFGESEERALLKFEDHDGGAMLLKNGRIVEERKGPRERW